MALYAFGSLSLCCVPINLSAKSLCTSNKPVVSGPAAAVLVK